MPTSRMCFCVLLLISASAWLAGCKEEAVPYIVDEDEIARAVRETSEGKELFRADGLITSDPYTMPDSATYRDSVVSSKHSIEVKATKTAADYGSLGMLQEALARVTDSITVRIRRIKQSDTTFANYLRVFTRYGFFLKLGGDNQPFVGWVLYGFNGYTTTVVDSTYITLNAPDGSLFYGDSRLYNRQLVNTRDLGPEFVSVPPYVRLTDLKDVPRGGRLRIEIKAPRRPLLTLKGDNGYRDVLMTYRGNRTYMDTVTTASGNQALYNLITVHSLIDSTGAPTRTGVFIPYRVP